MLSRLLVLQKTTSRYSIAVNELYQGKLRIVEDGDIVCGENYHPEEQTEEAPEQETAALENSEENEQNDENNENEE